MQNPATVLNGESDGTYTEEPRLLRIYIPVLAATAEEGNA